MRKKKGRLISLGMLILWIVAISIFISSDVYASAIQAQSSATIFKASCATCHGGRGLGGVTWVKDSPADDRAAPKIAGMAAYNIITMVRNGSLNGAMPAFGKNEITDAELLALANWLQANPAGVPLWTEPGSLVTLNILDADPWYSDGGTDGEVAGTPGADVRRVDLEGGETLKVVNTGRTWHTFTDSKDDSPAVVDPATDPKDSGFIGYAGNYKDAVGDLLQGQPINGVYYADQSTGLKTGCKRYLCKMHPYMQVEVCTMGALDSTYDPAGPTAVLGLTRAHKHPIGLPAIAGVGEVWVSTQSQEETTETGTTTVTNNSVTDMDGAYQVIDAATWGIPPANRIANVGNNPHNAWPGKDSGGNDVVLSSNWHDNRVTLMDANSKTVINTMRTGAANAHIMVTPGSAERFYVTHMGSVSIQENSVDNLALGLDPNVGGVIRGAFTPHGLWFCDNGVNILTADTLSNSATLYNISTKKRVTAGSGGASPLAPSIAGGIGGGCSRGFTNNAGTADISVYNLYPATPNITRNTTWSADPSNWLYKNAAGNIALRNTTTDQVPGGAFQARWAHLPIQTPVSPADSTHPRYMVTANKASFNVSVTALNASGNPTAVYTFPAGLGAHGVTYGRKSACEVDWNTAIPGTADEVCYYSYVTNTFEDYVSVYDLEKIGTSAMGAPGSALLAESVYVEGGAVMAVAALDPVVASLCDVVDLVGSTLVYDLPGGTDPGGDGNATGILTCGIGALGGSGVIAEGGPIGGYSYYVSNLPIGVLCPDCRSGVHAGDVPLTLTTGAALGGTSTGPLTLTATGAASKYTYLKEEVWVDTQTVACALGAGDDCVGLPDAATIGTINAAVPLDLDLGINTGGQGIVAAPAATPWP